jgi:hypothetical protein
MAVAFVTSLKVVIDLDLLKIVYGGVVNTLQRFWNKIFSVFMQNAANSHISPARCLDKIGIQVRTGLQEVQILTLSPDLKIEPKVTLTIFFFLDSVVIGDG